jgi:hypothetical protein
MSIYYVYAYIRTDGTPYYIGKGSGRRAYVYHYNIPVPKDKNRIIIMENNLTNVGALALERRYIRWWGRKDLGTGILRNRTDGGDGTINAIGPNRGKTFSDEIRQKLSNSLKGRSVWNKGLPNSVVSRKGCKHTETTKTKMRKPKSLSHRENIGIQFKNRIHWTNGIINKFCLDCPGPDFYRGRVIKKK